MAANKCIGTTTKGTKCKNDAAEGRDTCAYHHNQYVGAIGQPSQPIAVDARPAIDPIDLVDQLSIDAINQR